MRQSISLVIFLFLAALPLSLQATHIVGGEMTYRCLGNDQYEVKLTIFRDCFNGVPWFDDPAAIGIFNNLTNEYIDSVLVPLDLMLNDTIDPTLDNDCLVVPPNVCVNTTTYTTILNLPFVVGGYHLVYQRCCRNNTIANLILPEDVGATYSIVISEDALLECNTSPVFNEWPPLYLCVGIPFEIDQSAFDDNGDSLVYKLCNPLTGAIPGDPIPQPPNAPPYDTVPWLPGYSVNNQINLAPEPPMTIDPETGLLVGTPTVLGQFVIGICVEEYRNGVLIGVNRRDYQVNIGDCGVTVASFFAPSVVCGTNTVIFENESVNATEFEWYFGDPNEPGLNSTLPNPVFTFSDTGLYEVMLVAQPGDPCVDTFTTTIHIQPNSIFPDFSVDMVECANGTLLEVTDLSTDSISSIVAWDWFFVNGINVDMSIVQNPTFIATQPGVAIINLTVTAANGCMATTEQMLLIKPSNLTLDLGPDIIDCLASEIELDAGPGFVSYAWSGGSNQQTLLVTSPGTYSVTGTDSCGDVQTDEIVVALAIADLDLGPDIEICEGGSHTFSVTGFVEFSWSPADYLSCTDCADPTTTPAANIVYVLEATTVDGCTSVDTVAVTVLPNLETSETIEICEGQSVEVFGNVVTMSGVFSETFTTMTGCDSTHTVTVTVLPNVTVVEDIVICEGETAIVFGMPVTMSGEYQEIFTSQNGCDSTHIIAVGVLPNVTVIEDIVICEGETAIVFGMPVTMSGEYQEIFTSQNGCDSTHIIAVGVLPNVFTSENISICFGETVEIFGATVGTAGVYEMTFPAANSCDSTHTVTLAIYDEINIEIEKTAVSCFAGSDGSATATASGGTGGFSYDWGAAGNGATISGLSAGTYTVIVTDNSGCSNTTSVTIGQPTAVEVLATGVDVSCTELGSVSASASGGTGDHTYLWNTGDETATVTGLVAGTYVVTATDANGCEAVASVEITGALGPNVAITVEQQLTEDEPNSGELSVEIMAGTAPFTIEWNNGDSGTPIDSLGSGQYIVTVTDANGCTALDTAYLFVPACTGGKIWNDTDRDGCQEGGEFGMGGVELSLLGTDIWGNDVIGTTTSTINGEYIFEDLPPGDYLVFIETPVGYTLSPADACSDDFTDSDFDMNGVATELINLVEGHCCLIVDGGLYDACLNVYDPGAICCDQVLCGPGNDPAPIVSDAPATGASQIQYMWIFSHVSSNPDMGSSAWQPVMDAFGQPVTTAGYDPGPISQTTYFARCVQAVGCETWLETNAVAVYVDDVAVAAIEEPGAICVGDQVTFQAAPNGPGASYHWYFGPYASPSHSYEPSPTVTWNQSGYISISLQVDNKGCTSTDYQMIAVSNDPVYCGTAIIAPGDTEPAVHVTQLSEQVAVYPNPVSEKVFIEWGNDLETASQLEVLSMEGKVLMRKNVPENTHFCQADLGAFDSGIYMLRLKYRDEEQEVFKLVKR